MTADKPTDEIQCWLKVYHRDKYGFGGDTRVKVAVTEETEDEIRGYKVWQYKELTDSEITIRKDNVAGWEEYTPMERPAPSPENVKEQYVQGRIDEDGLEEKLEESRL